MVSTSPHCYRTVQYGLIDLEKRFFVPEDDEKIGRRAIVIWKALLEENSVVL